MEINMVLNAAPREGLGKGPSRRLRMEGRIPVVFYGPRQTTRALTVDYKEFKSVLFAATGSRSLFKLHITGQDGVEECTAMLKDHQIDPVKRTVIHADFYQVDITKPLRVEVPLILTGKAIGVEKGGLLQQLERTLTVEALPQDLPDQVVVDVSGVELGHSFHVRDVVVGPGARVVFDDNFSVATVIAQGGGKSATGDEATPA